MASQIIATCADCGTDWSGTTVVMCPMCGGININGTVTTVSIPTIPIPEGLESWYKKASKHVPKTET